MSLHQCGWRRASARRLSAFFDQVETRFMDAAGDLSREESRARRRAYREVAAAFGEAMGWHGLVYAHPPASGATKCGACHAELRWDNWLDEWVDADRRPKVADHKHEPQLTA